MKNSDKIRSCVGHRKRLKGRFIKNGANALADYELFELLLTYSIPRKDVKQTAKQLLRKFGSVAGIIDADLSLLISSDGVGENSAVLIKLIKALNVGYSAEALKNRKKISSASSAEEFVISTLSGSGDERFLVIFLDTKNNIIDHEIMFEGTLNQTAVYPRKILESVFNRKAASIIIAHNHPSGDVTPSREDINITAKIKTACTAADIEILDHLIVGKGKCFSFFNNNMM